MGLMETEESVQQDIHSFPRVERTDVENKKRLRIDPELSFSILTRQANIEFGYVNAIRDYCNVLCVRERG
ncbi:hypothetical protein C474_08747 [Halogeometricum pallidum JCM 14848]|uniref:Uncharacterized protein n=1 Tax=Halogeometricum pallidum JCM 14848 TaxID=1227487 RepID=M0D9I4_HALPD|nr:hypothetical protein C474_08747 [Halogeometricum pallidum JCM 14848]